MRGFWIAIAGLLCAPAVQAEAPLNLLPEASAAPSAELPPYLQCVPFARQMTGIQLYGDAWTWWDQAQGHYARGHNPEVGAVMAFRPHGNMKLGHVAAVTGVLDSRTVLLTHANWSPIEGRRGQIERNVRAVDVSPANDWSEVRVWYDPIGDLGTTPWPVEGFIYPDKAPAQAPRIDYARSVIASAPGSRKAAATPQRDVIGEIIRANS